MNFLSNVLSLLPSEKEILHVNAAGVWGRGAPLRPDTDAFWLAGPDAQ